MPLTITAEVEAIIQGVDASDTPLELLSIVNLLTTERAAMTERAALPEEERGCWSELVPLYLSTGSGNAQENPWGSYFRPMSSVVYENGTSLYFPEVDQVAPDSVEHWSERARNLKHPVLKARYADVVWELGRFITKSGKRDVEMARIAVDAYIDAITRRLDDHTTTAFTSAKRAVDLAAQINDPERIDLGRAALLGLHAEVMTSKTGHLWSRAFDHLIDHRKARTSEVEMEALVADLEIVLSRLSDSSNPETFDPHGVRDASERLSRYYTTKGHPEQVRRVHGVAAKTFEFHAGLSNATLASSFLQDSMDAYLKAGQPDEAERVRIAMQQKIRESRDEMSQHVVQFEITKGTMDERIAKLVVDDAEQTLVNLAYAFMPNPTQMEGGVKRMIQEAPLMSMISHQIMGDDRVAARIGSVDDDLSGRVLQHTLRLMQIELAVLHASLHSAVEKHELTPEDLVAWANRRGLFDAAKIPLLFAGIQAWFNRDFFKALHVIIPQIEGAMRKMVDVVGKPTTKAAGTVPGVSVSINMGDVLFNPAIIAALGPMGAHLALYMKVIYADPRGMNLRNEFAHGLLNANDINEGALVWVIHSLLVIGLWQKPEQE